MATPVLVDMFMKTATSLMQVAATGKVTTDKAFQKIFDSSMENSAKATQSTNEANEAKRSEGEAVKETDTPRPDKEAKTSASTKASREKSRSAAVAKDAKDAKKADEETLADKIEKLKKSDPESYNSIIANLDSMTLGDLLSKLGLNPADMSGLKPGVDLAGSVPENMKQALLSGDSKQIGSALASLGIGGIGNENFKSKQASQAMPVLSSELANRVAPVQSGAKAEPAGDSSTSLKNASSAPVIDGANKSKDAVASQASTPDVSPDNSGMQKGSSNPDNGSGGQAFNSGSSPAPVATNAPASESKPQISAVDSFKLADPASLASSAQGRTDAAPQQAVSKPVVTAQNMTNDTDQASAVNTQTAKTEQAQAQTNARPANLSRPTFERMVLDQVVDKARVIVRPNGSSSMVIKLDPPTLGRIDMRIEVKEGVVRAAIVADNHDVKNAIEGNLDALKRSLNANGLKVDEISVTVGGEQGFQFKNDSMAQNAGSQNHGDSRRTPHGQTANAPVAALDDSAPARVRAYGHSGLLNVVA